MEGGLQEQEQQQQQQDSLKCRVIPKSQLMIGYVTLAWRGAFLFFRTSELSLCLTSVKLRPSILPIIVVTPTTPWTMMLRPTFLTAARCAASNLSRTTVCLQRPLYPCLSAYANQPHSVPRIPSLRWYSAPAGLAKEEVQGRIIDLLKNFDKVREAMFNLVVVKH